MLVHIGAQVLNPFDRASAWDSIRTKYDAYVDRDLSKRVFALAQSLLDFPCFRLKMAFCCHGRLQSKKVIFLWVDFDNTACGKCMVNGTAIE